MKLRILVLLLVAALAATAAGCGGDDDEAAPAENGEAAEESFDVTLIQGVKGDEFYISMDCGAREAAEENNVSLDVQGPDEFDPSLQTPILNSVVAQNPDAILIAPTDTKAMIAPMTQAKDAGITIVEVDTRVDDSGISVSKIATDNLEGGREAARALAELIDEKGSVLVVNVKPGISTTDQRQQGFEEEIKKYPNIKYLGTEFSNNEPAKAASIVTATIAAEPDLAGIFATNLFSAEGSATGLRTAGKENVKMVGFDAGPAQVKQLQEGLVQALVAQNPREIGKLGVEQAVASLKGEDVEADIATGLETITQDNLEDPEIQKVLYTDKCA